MTEPAAAPAGQAPALEVAALRAAYGRHDVLLDVDLTVRSGVTAVLGASGSGKSTLLRAVAGFVTPTSGSIRVAGTLVEGAGTHLAPRRRGVGYVPQEGALFPHLTVAGNIGFSLRRGAARAARVAELLDLVELPSALASRRPDQLSGGQQQRVALARALANNPALVLLDEPFSSLDAGLRDATGLAVVRALRAADAAAVLVTHDQDEALSLADQVAVLSAGRFAQVSEPGVVAATPTETVATFLGEAALLRGVVDAVDTRDPAQVQVRLASGEVVGARLSGVTSAVVGDRVAVRLHGSSVAFPDPGATP